MGGETRQENWCSIFVASLYLAHFLSHHRVFVSLWFWFGIRLEFHDWNIGFQLTVTCYYLWANLSYQNQYLFNVVIKSLMISIYEQMNILETWESNLWWHHIWVHSKILHMVIRHIFLFQFLVPNINQQGHNEPQF